MVEQDRDFEERRRDEMAEKLAVYKREVKTQSIQQSPRNHDQTIINHSWKLQVANCETTARVMREEEARLEEVYNR